MARNRVFLWHLQIPTGGAQIRQIWPAGKPCERSTPPGDECESLTEPEEVDKLIKWAQHELPLNSWGVDIDLRVSFTIVVKMISKVTNRKWQGLDLAWVFSWLCDKEKLRVYQFECIVKVTTLLPLDGRQNRLPLCRYLTSKWSMRMMN